MLHQLSRGRDAHGRVVADIANDYARVRELVAPLIGESIGTTVRAATRGTVEAVAALGASAGDDRDEGRGVQAQAVVRHLGLHKSTVSRRLGVAKADGYLVNLETVQGRPGRWVLGDPLPDEETLLPTVTKLQGFMAARATAGEGEGAAQEADEESGCKVAAISGGREGEGGYVPPPEDPDDGFELVF
jgi:hypothetical protein